MTRVEYNIPENMDELFEAVYKQSSISYSIIDYSEGMSMDNIESLRLFIDEVGITDYCIEEDYGTQIILIHPKYYKRVVVDSGGLGDFYSHGFDCYLEE